MERPPWLRRSQRGPVSGTRCNEVSGGPTGAGGPRDGVGLGRARVPRARRPGAAAVRGSRAGGSGAMGPFRARAERGPRGVGGSTRAAEGWWAARCSGEKAELRLGVTFRPALRRTWAGDGPLGPGRRGLSPSGPATGKAAECGHCRG
ncbi:hypothetical protein NDU88_007336 [Pleurodeles waltl]|uniref:Uncharacterized protein n=1 Tax=Pleurodeles waltl TaxID=8319 RepID=A0AAV7N3F5_PLEWA|nr:hypothetical protein NDU88_007336 [Pleurodeles waltl]